MAEIEGNASHLAGRIQALHTVQKWIIDLVPSAVIGQALSPAGPITKVMTERENALKYEARQHQEAEAFKKGYEEEFDRAMELLRAAH